MAALPYMQLYPADYLADTMHLSAEEHGAYLLLLMNYWQTGKPIPVNRARAVARVPNDRWPAVEQALSDFFTTVDGTWVNKRIEADLKAATSAQKQRVAAGKASAEARKAVRLAKIKQAAKPDTAGPANERSTPVQRSLNEAVNDRSTNKEEKRREEKRTDTSNEVSKPTGGKPPVPAHNSIGSVWDQPARSKPEDAQFSPVAQVYLFWKSTMKKPATTMLDSKRASKIKQRLKDFTVEQLQKAILGCKASDFHMAQGDFKGGKKFNDLVTILRDVPQVEKFIELAEQANEQSGMDADLEAWLRGESAPVGETIVGEYEHEPE